MKITGLRSVPDLYLGNIIQTNMPQIIENVDKSSTNPKGGGQIVPNPFIYKGLSYISYS